MKKLHSVSFRVIMFFVICILLYSGILFAIVNTQLTKGLRN